MKVTQLTCDWFQYIQDYGDTLDLTISQNIPLKKVIEYIIKRREKAFSDRYVQLTAKLILFNGIHPFNYLSNVPYKVMKQAFDEVTSTSLAGVEFSKKMDSTIRELFAYQKLIQKGFSYKGKTPQKQMEDDFYLTDDSSEDYAIEVKSKQENEYFSYALENYIRGKMYFHDYKKNISIIEIKINQTNFQQNIDIFDAKIIVDDSIVNTIHFQNKVCNEIECNSSQNDVLVETQLENDKLCVKYNSDQVNFKLLVIEDSESQDITIESSKMELANYFIKNDSGKNIIELEFEKYLTDRLNKVKKQYLDPKKITYRKNDKFGGFIYLYIPWSWKWNKKSLSKSFEQLAEKLMKESNIRFPIYFYLHKYERQNMLIKVKIQKSKLTKFKSKYKKT